MMQVAGAEFELRDGYTDREGVCHRSGFLRLSTARDEMRVLGDFRVHLRPEAFLTVMLSQVLELGTLPEVNVGVVERLSSSDLTRLESLYRQLNDY